MFPFSGLLTKKKNKQKMFLRSQLLRLFFLILEKLKGLLNPKLKKKCKKLKEKIKQ